MIRVWRIGSHNHPTKARNYASFERADLSEDLLSEPKKAHLKSKKSSKKFIPVRSRPQINDQEATKVHIRSFPIPFLFLQL